MNSKSFRISPPSVRLSLVLLLSGLLFAAFAADTPDSAKSAVENSEAQESQKIRDDIGQLREENTKLKEENAQLRKENQQLRRLLAEKVVQGTAATPATNSAGAAQTDQSGVEADSQLTHWLTTSSGKRHNNHCRYFKTTEGRFCGSDEGAPCKLCGG